VGFCCQGPSNAEESGFIAACVPGSIIDDDEQPAGDGAMSDNWVGPGWWMASDGNWYPPRTPMAADHSQPLHHDRSTSAPSDASMSDVSRGVTGAESIDSRPATRWSRRTPDGQPVEGASALSDAEQRSHRAATRAERAAAVARSEPVSIKRPEEDEADQPELNNGSRGFEPLASRPIDSEPEVDAADVEASAVIELESPIDLRDPIDVGSSAQTDPVASAVVSDAVAGDLPVPPRLDQGSTPGLPERPALSFPTPIEASDPESRSSGTVSAAGMVDRGEGGADEAEGAISELVDSDQVDVGPASDDRPFPTTQEIPLQHAVLPALVERETQSRSRNGPVLLALAAALAVTCGVLGALLLQERSEVSDLRSELEQATTANEAAVAGLGDVSELNDEVRTLTLQNEQLQAQLNDMSALVLELPEGRVTEIVVPFTPVFADEENGRFIAMSSEGEYVVWAEGADGVITDSGQVSGSPTGLFAAARKAWISTDADKIDIVSLTNEEGLPSVDFGPAVFLAPEERAYWTYDQSGGAVVRLRKGDGGITATVPVPVPVVDLTIGAGSVWALGENGRVYRINTADFTVQAIDAGVDLISITAGPDALWTLSAADGSLRRVDPVTGEVLVTVPVGRDPIDATFAGSSVWVALRSGTSLIEVDTRTAAVISRTALPGTPTALHQGDSGVFVTLEGDVPLVLVASLGLPTEEGEGEDETSGDASDEG